jgi:hypothetical protein
LQAHVKDLLAPYEYPKEIEFIDALPMTTTGKVQRRVLRLQEEEPACAASSFGNRFFHALLGPSCAPNTRSWVPGMWNW